MRLLSLAFIGQRALSASHCDVTRKHAGFGFDLRIVQPRDLEHVINPVQVRLSLVITNGSRADEIRSKTTEYQVCYGALGASRCVSLLQNDENNLGLELPAWGELWPVQVVAWLQRKSCMTRIVKASVDVIVMPENIGCSPVENGNVSGKIIRPVPADIIEGEYVEVEVLHAARRGSRVCSGIADFRKCWNVSLVKTTLRTTIALPTFMNWRLYVWIEEEDGCLVDAPTSTDFAVTPSENAYHFGRYAHPRATTPWLSFAYNYTVLMPEDCGAPRAAACVLERRVSCGNSCHYFQHAAPFLLACWSFFRAYAHLRPVLVLRDGLYLGSHRWTTELLRAMRCEVEQHTVPRCAVRGSLNPGATSWTVSTPGTGRDLGWTPLSWLANSADAGALKARVLGPFYDNECRSDDAKISRVGILDRAISGNLLDVRSIVSCLEEAFMSESSARVDPTVAYFENATFAEQAAWVHSHDVIVAPHGAQMTNLVWLRPCAAVLELYPAMYFVPGYFLTLALNVGALAYFGYPGRSPHRDVERVLAREPHFMNNFRRAPIRLGNLDKLVDVVRTMISERSHCLGRQKPREIPLLQKPPVLTIVSPRHQDRIHWQQERFNVTVHVDALPDYNEADPFKLDDHWGNPGDAWWSVCFAAIGDRSCVTIHGHQAVISGTLLLPSWSGKHTIRLEVWLECGLFGSWISPASVDIVLCDRNDTALSIPLTGVELHIVQPRHDSEVTNPIAAQLHFNATPPSSPGAATHDFRTFRVCYASLDQRRCSLLWPHQRAVAAEEETLQVLEHFSLPAGRHQLCAWIETDESTAVVVDEIIINVVGTHPGHADFRS